MQACQDARRAYRNWFDSLSGKGQALMVRHPRLRSRKDDRQSIRLTRSGFDLTTGGVRVDSAEEAPRCQVLDLCVECGVTHDRDLNAAREHSG